MSTIFTSVKGNDNPNLRIPLLFMNHNGDVDKGIKIDEKFFKYELSDGTRVDSKAK